MSLIEDNKEKAAFNTGFGEIDRINMLINEFNLFLFYGEYNGAWRKIRILKNILQGYIDKGKRTEECEELVQKIGNKISIYNQKNHTPKIRDDLFSLYSELFVILNKIKDENGLGIPKKGDPRLAFQKR